MAKNSRVSIETLSKQLSDLTKVVHNLVQLQLASDGPAESPAKPSPITKTGSGPTPVPAPTQKPEIKKPTSSVGWVPQRVVAQPNKTAANAMKRAVRVELWQYDEYSQGSIVSYGTDPKKIALDARRIVTELNVENALTRDEKDTQWEAYYPEIWKDGKVDSDAYYAGNKRDGRPYYYRLQADGSWKREALTQTIR